MNEIIVYENEQKNKNIIYLENGEIVESYIEDEKKERLEGNIYIRKGSKNITWNAGSFCRHRKKQKCFFTY